MSPPQKRGGTDREAKRGADAEVSESVARNDSPSGKKRKRYPVETPTRGAHLTETSLDPPRFSGAGVALLAAFRKKCVLRPKQFFVAWSGVLTLAWSGFPPEIEALKRDIGIIHPALKPENPGSRWAKTTLGCLRDFKRLTPDRLRLLGEICDMYLDELLGELSQGVPVDALSLVTYECRSLERYVSEHVVRLDDAKRPTGRDYDPPSAAELAVVDRVVAQFSNPSLDAERYFFDAARDGSRESHYRETKLGVTLVARVRALGEVVQRFRGRVDAAFPGMYAWFDERSLHCTVRGIVD